MAGEQAVTQADQEPEVRQKLEDIQKWASQKIRNLETTPWERFYCQKLAEVLSQITMGMDHIAVFDPAEIKPTPLGD